MKAQNRRISEMTQKSYKSIYVEHENSVGKAKNPPIQDLMFNFSKRKRAN